MNEITPVLKEIIEITTTIETQYPELYRFLEENPMTLPAIDYPKIDEATLTEYLKSLKELLQHHRETRKKS